MPLSKGHSSGHFHAAISGQLLRMGVAEDSIGAFAFPRAIDGDP
jgi:hypothetical protein